MPFIVPESDRVSAAGSFVVPESDKLPTKLESVVRGGAQGLTLNWADELEAGVKALTDKGLSFKDAYNHVLPQIRAKYKEAQAENPISFGAGEFVGAAAPLIATGVTSPTSIGALGAVSGAGRTEANPVENPVGFGKDVAIEGAINYGLGKAGELAGKGVTKARELLVGDRELPAMTKSIGAEYRGVQPGIEDIETGKIQDLVYTHDPITGSTPAVPVEGATPTKMLENIKGNRTFWREDFPQFKENLETGLKRPGFKDTGLLGLAEETVTPRTIDSGRTIELPTGVKVGIPKQGPAPIESVDTLKDFGNSLFKRWVAGDIVGAGLQAMGVPGGWVAGKALGWITEPMMEKGLIKGAEFAREPFIKAITKTVDTLSKYAPLFQHAMTKGGNSVPVLLYSLQQTDPEFRKNWMEVQNLQREAAQR